ncbi:MAG: DUF2156 domain-containing protein [Spirochaeta sp.]|nr:DUF2156 domain-containing protein [Spirochaeta sp.]
MEIPQYPEGAPLDLSMRSDLHPRLSMLPDGVSEFTFAGLYLFRDTYHYQVGQLPGDKLLITGEKEGKEFFMLPCGLPEDQDLVTELFNRYDYLKGLSERNADDAWIALEKLGLTVHEDRDNFDYLYLKQDLAELAGKKFHKKRNHVNAFVNNYEFDEQTLRERHIPDALGILEAWQAGQDDRADYAAAREALERFRELDLKGYIVYVGDTPAAYTIGEPLMKGRSFVVHFEKAADGYRGIYQFINKAFAAMLPKHYKWINREQDLGDEGLRQSKMTYRPSGFVKKYRVGRALPEMIHHAGENQESA